MRKSVLCSLFIALLICSSFGCKSDNNDENLKKFWEYYNSKIEQFELENEQFKDTKVDAVFLGDSLTDGYDLKKFYPEYIVLNRGISGDTTIFLEERLEVSLFAIQPKVAVMLIGANNMDTMFENYENILKSFEQKVPHTKIILLSLTSMGGEWGKKNQLAAYNNVQIKMLAEKYNYEFVDLYSALLNLEDGEIYDEYAQPDGGHLTTEGYQVLTKYIKPVLQKLLEEN